MRLDESYRSVTIVLVLNSQCGKIPNIFLTTIAAALWWVRQIFRFHHHGALVFSFTVAARQRSVFNRDGHL
jgi:hypothetical protein